ncbi:EAL domain-containing protein [Rhodoferax sp.]|uniref:EAL domain-containing protein n=1 Tax=Rhodoferax sp. TaxID=50421 RepID=UPI0027306E91|nr:EAL domain-containing protein [Rhodoferax sp.]MDP2441054.1 EAL domain-containing protein [Rhodoferax sp.]
MTINLINNIAFLIALAAAGQVVVLRLPENMLNRQVLFGLLFGGATVLGMANPVNFAPGVFFDGRSIVLAVAGVAGGGVTAAIAAGMAALYRYQQGGIGAPVGIMIVLLSALLGVLARQWWLRRTHPPRPIDYLALGVVVQLMQLAAFTQVPNRAGYAFIEQAWWVLLLFYPPATMLLCMMFRSYEQQLINKMALRENERLLLESQRIAHIGGWSWAFTGPIQWTDETYRIYGVSPETFTPTFEALVNLVHPEDRPLMQEWTRACGAGEKPAECEFRCVWPDGTIRFLSGCGEQIYDDDNRPTHIFGTVQDITERKLTAEALRHTQALPANAEKIGRVGGWEIDIQTRQTTWTEAVYDIHELDGTDRLTVDEGINYYTPESQPIIEQAVRRALEQGESFDLELEIITAKGNRRNVHTMGEADLARGKVSGFFQDITERKEAQIASDALRNQLQATLDALPDLLFEVDAEGRIVSYHSHRNDLLAAPPEVFLGKRFADLLPPDAASACQHAINEAVQNGFSSGVTYRLALPQGEHWFELSVALLHADAKPDQRFIMICRDITERMRANESLQQAASVFGHTREGISITNANGTIVDVNEAFTRITGYSREDVIGRNPRILSSGRQDAEFYRTMWSTLTEQGHWSGEVWNRRKDGEVYAELLTISAIRDGQGTTQQYVALFSDITAIKAHQSQLEHIAHFDALTNLPNRVLLADRLHQTMAQAQRRHQQLAVVYLDLDGFKAINDHHGHEAGDQVLITLARRMKETLREGDTLARLGGDEFVAVLTDLEDTLACMPLLERLLAAAALPVSVGGLSLQVSASLGVTFYPQAQDIEADQLLRQADQAMYQAKVAGKNRYCVFDAAHDSSIRDHHESLERIRLALENSEFVLFYQPKVNMHSGQVIGAEALIRWQHPEKGLLAPAAFLPLIENHPLAIDVGEWVIDTALHQIEVWRAAGLDLPVSVNIGARQLQQGDFVERLRAILAKHPQVHPGCIELEVLETSALSDMDQVSQVIEDCATMGVNFALDDFGTGYSSLTYLKRLRVALLKIDQSFVRDMLDDPDDLAILQGIIGLAAAFKREVIAEGVETVAHGTALLQLGCELAQGYGIARPMPPDRLPGWAATWQPDAAWGAVSNSGDASRSTAM